MSGPEARTAGRTIVRRPRRSQEAQWRHLRRRRVLEPTVGLLVPAVLLGVWQVASSSGWIDHRLYPSPVEIVAAAGDLIESGRLQHDVWVTTWRVLQGYVLGSAAGFVVGTVMGNSRWVRKSLEPLLTALYVVPKLALLPIFFTMFGLGDGPKIAIIVTTVFFFVWIDTMEAMTAIDEGYREAARSFEVTRLQMFWHVVLPASLPKVMVSLRISMGVAVLVVIAAEFLVGNDGLGYLIFNSRALLILSWSYVGIVAVSLLGVVLSNLVAVIGGRLTRWQGRDN